MSEGDVWSVHEPRPAADAAGSPAAPRVVLERPRDVDAPVWTVAAVFFLLAGVLQAAVLLMGSESLHGSEPGYDSISLDILFGVRAVVMLVCGVLLLLRRAREFAGGLAVGFGLELLIGYSWQLRPSKLRAQWVGHGWLLFVGAIVMLAVGTVVVLVLVLQRREHAVEHRTRAERRADRVAVVALGFTGAILWWIATTLTWFRLGLSPILGGRIPVTSECCSWSQDDGWKQGSILAAGAAIVVLALIAATARSRVLGAGLLLGLVAAALQDFAVSIAILIAPLPTIYGIHYKRLLSGIGVVDSTTLGFWFGLIGLLLLSVAALTRLALGARKAAYPQNELGRIAS